MKLLRGAAAMAVARMVYEQVRKPENQARLKVAIDRARDSARSRRR